MLYIPSQDHYPLRIRLDDGKLPLTGRHVTNIYLKRNSFSHQVSTARQMVF